MSEGLLADFARADVEAFAAVLGRSESSEIRAVLDSLPDELAAATVARLPYLELDRIVHEASPRVLVWLDACHFDDAVILLSRLQGEHKLELVDALRDADRQRRLRQFLYFPAHCAGAVTSSVVLRLARDRPIASVLEDFRAADGEQEVPAVVVDDAGRFVGKLNLWKVMLLEQPAGHVRDFVLHSPTLHPETSLGSARDLGYWDGHLWLPVVDHEGRVLGAVSRARIAAAAAGFEVGEGVLLDSVAEVGGALFRVSGDLLSRVLTDRPPS